MSKAVRAWLMVCVCAALLSFVLLAGYKVFAAVEHPSLVGFPPLSYFATPETVTTTEPALLDHYLERTTTATTTAHRKALAEPAPPTTLPVTWIIDLTFVDATHGWVLGRSAECTTERLCPIALSATIDGGRTWQSIPAPEAYQAGSIAPNGVEFVRFANHTHGWLFGSALFSTHDGGQSWTQHPLEGEIIALEPVGNSVWAIERICSNTALDDCALRLLVSSDQHQTWEAALVQPPLQGQGARIVRADTQHAWIIHEGGIVATSDGRASWQETTSPCAIEQTWITRMVALDSQNLWMLCSGSSTPDVTEKLLYTSTDGGKEWNLTAATSKPQVTGLNNLPAAGYPNDLAVTSSEQAFLAILSHPLLRTSDGGATWQQIPAQSQDIDALAEGGGVWRVLFADALHGWAVGNRWNARTETLEQQILRTTDGGIDWAVVAQVT